MPVSVIADDRYYIRDPKLVAVGRHDRFVFVRDGSSSAFDGIDAPAMSAALEQLVAPTRGGDLAVDDGSRAALEALVDAGSLLEAAAADALADVRDRVLVEN